MSRLMWKQVKRMKPKESVECTVCVNMHSLIEADQIDRCLDAHKNEMNSCLLLLSVSIEVHYDCYD